MAKLTPAQIYALARKAGFSRSEAISATAIALAESGGDPGAHNPNPPDDSYGLWQINMLGAMGPERRRLFGITSNTELLDPHVNARAAYAVYQRQGFGAWSVWPQVRKASSPEAQAALRAAGGAESALDELVAGIPGKVVGAVVDPVVKAIGQAFQGAVGPLISGARTIAVQGAFVVLGLGLVAMGAWRLVGPGVKRVAGQAAGAAGGAAGGAAAGSIAGPVGTVAGGVAGGLAGRAAAKQAQQGG
jgi:hypothetical protein